MRVRLPVQPYRRSFPDRRWGSSRSLGRPDNADSHQLDGAGTRPWWRVPDIPDDAVAEVRARWSTPVSTSPTRTYVIDTSVLLSDPGALARFAEHDVVLPLVVISEL